MVAIKLHFANKLMTLIYHVPRQAIFTWLQTGLLEVCGGKGALTQWRYVDSQLNQAPATSGSDEVHRLG